LREAADAVAGLGRWTPRATLSAVLSAARVAGACDVHLTTGRPVFIRAPGATSPTMLSRDSMTAEVVEGVVREIVPSRLAGTLAESGACVFAFELHEQGRYRVSVSREEGGYTLALRVLAKSVPTLESPGLSRLASLSLEHGLVLVVGARASGKSSTLAALVDHLNDDPSRHILTIEDPIEYVHRRKQALVSQREVGVSVSSVDAALRAAMREDADAIAIGELYDADAIALALDACARGRLVLATMTALDASDAVDRLVFAFPPRRRAQAHALVARATPVVITQRLVHAPGIQVAAAVDVLAWRG
jgi:twitching motility protein PilT